MAILNKLFDDYLRLLHSGQGFLNWAFKEIIFWIDVGVIEFMGALNALQKFHYVDQERFIAHLYPNLLHI